MNRTVKTLSLMLSLFSTAAHGADDAGLTAGVFTPPREAPEFSLQGSNGAELKLDTYRGKVVILGFGFTSCPEICPTTLAVLAQTRRRLGADAEDLQVVYVTVDPQTDSPEQMRKYLATFDPTFIGGTGSEEQLAQVRKEYGIIASKKDYGSNYTFAHSSYTYLIDRDGKLRALMTYGHTPADYVHDVRILLQE